MRPPNAQEDPRQMQLTISERVPLVIVAFLVALALLVLGAAAAPGAGAQTYRDVGKHYWAYSSIKWVTNRGPAGNKLLDDFGSKFKPDQPLTREQLARTLVIALGLQDETVKPVALPDMPPSDPYYWFVQIALAHGLVSATDDGFHPDQPVLEWQADRAVVRLLKRLNPKNDWSMLTALDPNTWEPNAGWKTGAPGYLPWEVAARQLGLRYDHPADKLELFPTEAMPRGEMAYTLRAALNLSTWQIGSLSSFDKVTLPPLSARQKQIISFALDYVGYPYVWGGEWDGKDSPYGWQAHGGFDCSGFVWWVLKIHFKYPISVNERGASNMAQSAKPRISRKKLLPGDIIFFGPKGPSSPWSTIYHAAIYLGNGWFIQSTGSSDGVSLASLDWPGYWKTYFAWGRRVLKKSELAP
jgi:NlpC/P60 family/S-layer homology domain